MINQASGLPSTTFHRKNGQLVIYVFLQDTSGYIRKIRWDQHGWSKNTEPPLVQAKSGASFSVVGWSDDDSEDHVSTFFVSRTLFSFCLKEAEHRRLTACRSAFTISTHTAHFLNTASIMAAARREAIFRSNFSLLAPPFPLLSFHLSSSGFFARMVKNCSHVGGKLMQAAKPRRRGRDICACECLQLNSLSFRGGRVRHVVGTPINYLHSFIIQTKTLCEISQFARI